MVELSFKDWDGEVYPEAVPVGDRAVPGAVGCDDARSEASRNAWSCRT